MKVRRGRVLRVAGFLVSVRDSEGKECVLDCGLAFTAFRSGDPVSLVSRNGRVVRAANERTGLLIRLDAVNDLDQVLTRSQIISSLVPLLGAVASLAYWRHCWARRRQTSRAWSVWLFPALLGGVMGLWFAIPLPPHSAVAPHLLSALALGAVGTFLTGLLWPGLMLMPHVAAERVGGWLTDQGAQRALDQAPKPDWSTIAMVGLADRSEPQFDMSFLDAPLVAVESISESSPVRFVKPAGAEVIALQRPRVVDRLEALAEKTDALRLMCEELAQEHQAIRGELMRTSNEERRGRRAQL